MAHVLPVANDVVLHGIRDLQEGTHCRGLIDHHDIFDLEVVHTLLCTENRAPDDGGKDMLREVGACIAKLRHDSLASPSGVGMSAETAAAADGLGDVFTYLDKACPIVEHDGDVRSHFVPGQQSTLTVTCLPRPSWFSALRQCAGVTRLDFHGTPGLFILSIFRSNRLHLRKGPPAL
jgi:hypothetical protein